MNPKFRPPSRHSGFFSSLKQVEKRLKLESPTPSPPLQESDVNPSIDSLSSPIYLHADQEPNNNGTSTNLQESSEPPSAFLSSSSAAPQDEPETTDQANTNDVDDIQLLTQLLGLSNLEDGSQEERGRGRESGYGCDGGFYERVVGMKGPKCRKQVERLDGWIKYFSDSMIKEERKEPLRLAFLLLGKAASDLEGLDGGSCGLEFPTSIEEFLHFDPPIN